MQKTKLSSLYEPALCHQLMIHIDEAGRGPLAGPVTVGAASAVKKIDTSLFKDSKVLTKKRRENAFSHIQELSSQKQIVVGTGSASASMIDKQGIIPSLQKASLKAIHILLKQYCIDHWFPALHSSVYGEDQIAYHHLSKLIFNSSLSIKKLGEIATIQNTHTKIKSILIDGNHTFGLDKTGIQTITIIKGDSKNALISLASIAAKVERDRYMQKTSLRLPEYGIAQHKGYGTKKHREAIAKHGISGLHRSTYCSNIKIRSQKAKKKTRKNFSAPKSTFFVSGKNHALKKKPSLLLHICCAPDLARPLRRLKNHFKLYLFRYNPNIHPRKEHTKRYDQFIKLIGLEKGDYEIIEDRYDPKEFFDAMIDEAETIEEGLSKKSKKEILTTAGEMEERSSRCNPCYSMRLVEAAKNAAKHNIPYFTSTLLISPKKKMDKLFNRGVDAETRYPTTKFLRFNFAKNSGYQKATQIAKETKLFRQNYCGCGWTVPKKGEKVKEYRGG